MSIQSLWRPIESLEDKYSSSLLLYSPDLVDLDFNPSGATVGHWQDDEGWVAAVWNGYNADTWIYTRINPTHFLIMEGPQS